MKQGLVENVLVELDALPGGKTHDWGCREYIDAGAVTTTPVQRLVGRIKKMHSGYHNGRGRRGCCGAALVGWHQTLPEHVLTGTNQTVRALGRVEFPTAVNSLSHTLLMKPSP